MRKPSEATPPWQKKRVGAPPPPTTPEPVRLRKIAACVDGSLYAEGVAAHAVRVASALDADLTLLRVIEPGSASPLDPVAWDLRMREVREEVARLADATNAAGPVNIVVVEGNAADQICSWVRENNIDLTVLGTRGERSMTDRGLGGTVRVLLDWLPTSLLLVPAASRTADAYRTILVPLDGSLHAESVMPLVGLLADDGENRVVLAHVVPIPELTETAPLEDEARELRDRLVRRNRRVAEEYLQRVRGYTTGNITVRTISDIEDVRAGIGSLIRVERPDLLVLSTHGHGRRTDMPFGSVASYLIGQARVPLLIVRSRQPLRPGETTVAASPIRLPSAPANG